jgi:arylformamidase
VTADSIDRSGVPWREDGSQDWQEIRISRQAPRLLRVRHGRDAEGMTAEGKTADPATTEATSAPAADAIAPPRRRLVELSHVIEAGMVTLPSLPGPEITTHLSREASQASYAPGTTFEIGRISMVANTGTYLDSPYHRFAEGADLAQVSLDRLAELPAVVVSVTGSARLDVGPEALSTHEIRGRAVLLHTGDDSRFGTPEYVRDAAFLGRDGARWLVENGAVLVGIDAANIDDMADATRPAHTILLEAGIPVVEHLTGLGQLPPTGSTFSAVPPRVRGFGTFPVRAFASLPA